MKKCIIFVICLLLLTGCSGKKQKRLEAMERYGKEYYEQYGKTYDVDEYSVTLEHLRDANEKLKQNYDLTVLEKCEGTTSIIFQIKNNEIKNFKIKLNC